VDPRSRHANQTNHQAIGGRNSQECHVRTEVVTAQSTEPAASASNPWLDNNPLAAPYVIDCCSDVDDDAGRFVAKDKRRLDDAVADSAFAVQVQVRPADSDDARCDYDLVRTGLLTIPRLDRELQWLL
jgi:hypothetical protein